LYAHFEQNWRTQEPGQPTTGKEKIWRVCKKSKTEEQLAFSISAFQPQKGGGKSREEAKKHWGKKHGERAKMTLDDVSSLRLGGKAWFLGVGKIPMGKPKNRGKTSEGKILQKSASTLSGVNKGPQLEGHITSLNDVEKPMAGRKS